MGWGERGGVIFYFTFLLSGDQHLKDRIDSSSTLKEIISQTD